MNNSEQNRFDELYRKHPRALKLRRTCQRTRGGGERATETRKPIYWEEVLPEFGFPESCLSN